jgi:DNA repair protein RadC
MKVKSEVKPYYGKEQEEKVIQQALAILEKRLKKPDVFLNNSDVVYNYLVLQLGSQTTENFGAIFLNTKLGIIKHKVFFHGTINIAVVHPREIIKEALLCAAASIILFHNHPSFSPEPSPHDLALTRHIKDMAKLFEIELLDHIIIYGEKYNSMAETGDLHTL